jgi:hypothetical protein
VVEIRQFRPSFLLLLLQFFRSFCSAKRINTWGSEQELLGLLIAGGGGPSKVVVL